MIERLTTTWSLTKEKIDSGNSYRHILAAPYIFVVVKIKEDVFLICSIKENTVEWDEFEQGYLNAQALKKCVDDAMADLL